MNPDLSSEEVIKLFKAYGLTASYHFADDSGKEYSQGSAAKKQALDLFDQFPKLEPVFREVAKGFLWSLEIDRPTKGSK